MSADEGGDPPCWAHLFVDDPSQPAPAAGAGSPMMLELGAAGPARPEAHPAAVTPTPPSFTSTTLAIGTNPEDRP